MVILHSVWTLNFIRYLLFLSQTNLDVVFHFGNLEDVVVLQNVAVLHRGLPSVTPQDVVKFFGTRVENWSEETRDELATHCCNFYCWNNEEKVHVSIFFTIFLRIRRIVQQNEPNSGVVVKELMREGVPPLGKVLFRNLQVGFIEFLQTIELSTTPELLKMYNLRFISWMRNSNGLGAGPTRWEDWGIWGGTPMDEGCDGGAIGGRILQKVKTEYIPFKQI